MGGWIDKPKPYAPELDEDTIKPYSPATKRRQDLKRLRDEVDKMLEEDRQKERDEKIYGPQYYS
jgi:hypothetical protein